MQTTTSNVIRVGSAPMIHSPGTWRWFLDAKRTQTKKWSVAFLKAFTCDRITPKQVAAVLAGQFTTTEEPRQVDSVDCPTLVLSFNDEKV